ncbi:GINS subunit domain-containing protein [Entamoeba marina]
MSTFIAEETKVTVEALKDIDGLGFLDKSKGISCPSLTQITQTQQEQTQQPDSLSTQSQNVVSSGRRFDLPLWLAIEMQRNGYCRIIVNDEFNKQYSKQFIQKATDVFTTNPVSVNFNKFPYYFEVGGMIAKEIGDVDLARSLRDMMLLRLRRIYDEACNCDQNSNAFIRTLTISERNLYQQVIEMNQSIKSVKMMEDDTMTKSAYCDLPLV